ncbi:MAG: hypothetical protein MHPSP_003400, partial [Paramarteilia canceri]
LKNFINLQNREESSESKIENSTPTTSINQDNIKDIISTTTANQVNIEDVGHNSQPGQNKINNEKVEINLLENPQNELKKSVITRSKLDSMKYERLKRFHFKNSINTGFNSPLKDLSNVKGSITENFSPRHQHRTMKIFSKAKRLDLTDEDAHENGTTNALQPISEHDNISNSIVESIDSFHYDNDRKNSPQETIINSNEPNISINHDKEAHDYTEATNSKENILSNKTVKFAPFVTTLDNPSEFEQNT